MPNKKRETIDEVEEERQTLGQRSRNVMNLTREKFEHAKEKTEKAIQEHPFESVLIAAGVGAIVGAVVALGLNALIRRK